VASQKKTVQFDLFKAYYLKKNKDGSQQECLYDLTGLLQHIANHPFSDTKKKIFGDTQMFHVCRENAKSPVWELQLLHLREKMLPGIADDSGTYELIKLEDNQYPAESTTMLYDAQRCVLCMQRNIYGTSIKALEQLLEQISPAGTPVLLKPVLIGNRIGRINEDKLFRKVILAVDCEQLTDETEQQALKNIITSVKRYQGRIVRVELGFGRQKKGLLNAAKVNDLVREAYGFSGTQNLRVSFAENEDTAFETINLLDDRASYRIEVDYSRGNPITHERLYRMCLGKYMEEHETD
jgi:hypothetical protein